MTNHLDIVAMVLAAGEGTRMRPLTYDCPKPLLPFRGRPILSYILENIQEAGLSAVSVNTHHLAAHLHTWLHANAPQVTVHHEPVLLGSGGGVRAMDRQGPRAAQILYHNGDILTDADLGAMFAHHKAQNADVTMLVVAPEAADGSLRYCPRSGAISQLPSHHGPVQGPEDVGIPVSFGGIMIFRRELLERLPHDVEAPCILRDAITPAFLDGARVIAFAHAGRWSDLGTPARWLEGLRAYQAPPFADETIAGLSAPVVLSDGADQVRFIPA